MYKLTVVTKEPMQELEHYIPVIVACQTVFKALSCFVIGQLKFESNFKTMLLTCNTLSKNLLHSFVTCSAVRANSF